jgi:Cthe_2314-like HEPN
MGNQPSLSVVRDHRFVGKVLLSAVAAQKGLRDKALIRVDAEYERVPDEHEFYLVRIGKCLADLLTCCEHLDHIPLYIANYRETSAMKRAGITRHKYIVLHIEDYLIRVGGLQDRCVKLIDAAFHLLNDSRNTTSQVVLKNIKVVRTEVPSRMKEIARLVQKYISARNEVVHHQAYTDNQLRTLEMYHIIKQRDEMARTQDREHIQEIIKELTAEVIRDKRKEFKDFNGKLAVVLPPLFPLWSLCMKRRRYD